MKKIQLSATVLLTLLICTPVYASLSASLGATQLDGMTKFADCNNESIGYREGLIADRLEVKLANTANLPQAQRQQWLNDIAILRQVQMTRQVDRTNNQHYLLGLSGPEQQAINSMSIRHGQEIHLKCEQKHGGMLRYSPTSDQSGQRRYEDELRSKMGTPIDINTIPVEPLEIERSAAEIEAERKAKDAANIQAMKQKAAQLTTECMAQSQGLRPKLLAQMLQKKLDASPNLSAKDKADFQADIQAAWAAAGQGLVQVQSADPQNPYRAESRLTPQEQTELGTQYSQQLSQSMMNCASVKRGF